MTSPAIERLVGHLGKLPGLGPRSARRAACTCWSGANRTWSRCSPRSAPRPKASAPAPSAAISMPRTLARSAPIPSATARAICVVEQVADLWALERTLMFRGRYHVLGGLLSALDGIGPEDLAIAGLVARAGAPEVSEIILATSATVDGQTTAHYVADRLGRERRRDLPPRPRSAGRRRARLSRRRHAGHRA